MLQAAGVSTTPFPQFPLYPPTVHANASQHISSVHAAAAQVSAARGQEAGFYHLLQQPSLPPSSLSLLPGMPSLSSSLSLSSGLSSMTGSMTGSMAAAGGGGGGRGEGGRGGGGGGGGGGMLGVAAGGVGGGGSATGSGGHRCTRCGHLKRSWPGLHSDGKNGREPCSVSMEGVELPKLRRTKGDKGKCVHPGCTTCKYHI